MAVPHAAPAATATAPTVASASSADAVLEALDPEQRLVATSVTGPLCVLAGAGTGKTRALTHRIAYGALAGAWAPQHVLAVTFTARAAGEMRTRLRALGVGGAQARTFHAAALRQLGYFWPQVVGGALPRLQEHKAPLVAEAAARLRRSVDRTAVRDLAAEVEWAKATLVTPERYVEAARRAGRDGAAGFAPEEVARLLPVYEDVKTDRGVLDFEDVLLLTAGVLEERAEVADAVRRQYRHLVVDEYQDVSPLQQRLLDLWLGDRHEVCVVGDPAQTIYSFTGASPRSLLDFPRRHPGAAVVRLVRDYRSTPQVVDLANRVLAQARRGPGTPAPLELVAQQPPGPAPTFREEDDDTAEAVAVASSVRDLLRTGVRASEVAVLYRTNGQSEPLETALSEVGVPYLLRGGERFFSRREVRDAVLLLRGAARGGAAAEGPLGEVARDVLGGAGWSAEPPTGTGATRERWESLQALAALADEVAAVRPEATLTDLVAELEERATAQHAPVVEGVTLASLHAAKGLEWDAVFLVGLSEGLMPISFATTAEQVEEERRLLYVGITRARRHLALSWSRSRTPGGRGTRSPSRFLDGVRPARSSAADARGVAGGDGVRRRGRASRAAPATCRTCGTALSTAAERKVGRCGQCPPTYDEAVLDALREWRTRTAKQASVPAYVVFTDATLVAIAEAAPADVAALARVPGVGAVKLERYGDDVLALLSGGTPTT